MPEKRTPGAGTPGAHRRDKVVRRDHQTEVTVMTDAKKLPRTPRSVNGFSHMGQV